MALLFRCTVISLLCVMLMHGVWGLTLQVEPKTTECFYQKLDAGTPAQLEFVVTRGGLLDINVKVTNPSGATLHEALYFSHDGEETVLKIDTSETGVYSFCFDNEMSRWTAKVVNFEIVIEKPPKPEDQGMYSNILTARTRFMFYAPPSEILTFAILP